jgi:hypothetical protein
VFFLKNFRFNPPYFYCDSALLSVGGPIVEIKYRKPSTINRCHAVIFSLGKLSHHSRCHSNKSFAAACI